MPVVTLPRLRGRALRLARLAVENPAGVALARRNSMLEFGVDRLLALPPEARAGFDAEPRPIAGAPPRSWGNSQVDPSGTHGHGTLRDAFVRGDDTPSAHFERLADRIASGTFGESVHSPYVSLDLERARRDAEASTERHRAGAPRSPIDGIPVCVKDHHHFAGLPTRAGTSWMNEPAVEDGFMVARLRAAGAVLYAKTHTTEWGLQPTGFNPHFAMPRNVYSREHGAGGSSTGAGVAVALGHATMAIGSDGGGSIRIPAALNGVFGIKPGFVRIGRTGDVWGRGTVGTNGPLGRTTRHCVELLAASSGIDPEDPMSTYAGDGDPATAWRKALGRGIRGARIGVWSWAFEQATAPVAKLCMDALRVLEREGATLVETVIPYSEHVTALGVLSLGVEGSGMLTDVLDHYASQTSDDVHVSFRMLASIPAGDYIRSRQTRAVLRRTTANTLAALDLLAAPSTAVQAPRYALADDGVPLLDGAATRGLTVTNFLGNLTGIPSGQVPVGMHDGLPVGLQFYGDAWDEASVFAAMAACERAGFTALPRPSAWWGG